MKKVIVHVVNSNILSGLEKISCNIIKNLNSKYEMIYVTKNGDIVKYLKENGIRYYLIKKMSVKEIKKMLMELKPDLIHAHDYRASCIVSLTKTNIPIISHLHNNCPWLKTFHPYSFLYLFSSLKFKKIIIVSNIIEKEYIFKNLIKNKFLVLNNSINEEDIFSKINKNNTKKYDICCVARLTKQKDPERFIKIIYKLKKDIPNIKAIWVGDGELYNKCLKLIKKYKLECNLELIGYQENPYKYMNKSKIFMLVSKWEGYALVICEALCLGLPCVVSNVVDISETIDKNTVYFCQSDLDYINSVKELLNNDKYKLYSKISVLKFKELLTLKEYLNKIEEIYESIFYEK